ncbi:MAG: flavodoxin domain-containing protein [Bacillota bacterium]|nr:flavodoxin domain-containing protein [Bacillota bacterium]
MEKKKDITRRQFLVAGAAVTLATLSGGYVATRGPQIDYYETAASGNISTDQSKVLVAYASQYGTTGEVAREIANTFVNQGVEADVKLIENVTDLSQYNNVIVGSSVRIGKWLPEATEFVENNKKQLSKLNVAYFLTSLTLGTSQKQEEKDEIAKILDDIQQQIPEVKPLAKGLFAGVLDFSKLSPAMKMGLKIMGKVADKEMTEGDYRDWKAIGTWAREVKQIMS